MYPDPVLETRLSAGGVVFRVSNEEYAAPDDAVEVLLI